MTTLKIFCILVLMAALLFGAASTPNPFTRTGLVPAETASIATRTVYVDAIVLTNNSAADATVRITDHSADCQYYDAQLARHVVTECSLVPNDMVVSGKSIYAIQLHGVAATGGISWAASDGTAVVGRIIGHY
jgi:hypothetical protein